MYGHSLLNCLEVNMSYDRSVYSIEDLKEFDDKICKIAKNYNLDWYPINYEICDYYEMI